MINRNLSRSLLVLLLATGLTTSTNAQQPAPPTSITLHVRGLSSAGRDALTNDLRSGTLELVYACVPAGILVFECTDPAARAALRDQALAKANEHANGQDVRELNMDRAQAEERCAQARNQ